MATEIDLQAAARRLHAAWRDGVQIDHLPPAERPVTRADGYDVQARVVTLLGERPAGWKIAATSSAGARHIGVSGPLAGRILSPRVFANGATVDIATNTLRVAEAEFGFRMARAVDGAAGDEVEVERVVDAVAAIVPCIELPDARFLAVPTAGEQQLIADLACVGPVVVGSDVYEGWRDHDLASHHVSVRVDGVEVATGRGGNALGDPRRALAWLATELLRHGHRLDAGDLVITGTCVTPVPVVPGHDVTVDFGVFGQTSVVLV